MAQQRTKKRNSCILHFHFLHLHNDMNLQHSKVSLPWSQLSGKQGALQAGLGHFYNRSYLQTNKVFFSLSCFSLHSMKQLLCYIVILTSIPGKGIILIRGSSDSTPHVGSFSTVKYDLGFRQNMCVILVSLIDRHESSPFGLHHFELSLAIRFRVFKESSYSINLFDQLRQAVSYFIACVFLHKVLLWES